MSREFVIAPRFCGPEGFGNGGYVTGILGQLAFGPTEITIRKPAPLDKPLTIEPTADGHQLLRGERLIAESKAYDAPIDPPAGLPLQEAVDAEKGYEPPPHHNYKCFVCGHRREEGDGMRIHTGPTSRKGYVAGTWIPDGSLADESGDIEPIFSWAVLDCPSASAIGGEIMIMLGRMAARIENPVRANTPHIVVAESRGEDGRKRYASSAIYSADGELCAASVSTWITVPPEQWQRMSGRPPGDQR